MRCPCPALGGRYLARVVKTPISDVQEPVLGAVWTGPSNVDAQGLECGPVQSEAMLDALTSKVRRDRDVLYSSRRRRIALGSRRDVEALDRRPREGRETQGIMRVLQ